MDVHIRHCQSCHVFNGGFYSLLHGFAGFQDILPIGEIQIQVALHRAVLDRQKYALGQVPHARSGAEFFGAVAVHGDSLRIRGSQRCDHGDDFVGDVYFPDPFCVFDFIYCSFLSHFDLHASGLYGKS